MEQNVLGWLIESFAAAGGAGHRFGLVVAFARFTQMR